MGLLGTRTQESYYNQSQTFVGDGEIKIFAINTNYFNPLPVDEDEFKSSYEIFINNIIVNPSNYTYSSPSITFTTNFINIDIQESDGSPKDEYSIKIRQTAAVDQYGGYQFISINDIVNNFMVSYVGEDKIINKVRKADIAFHAQRGLQELSYDTLRSSKSQEIEISPSLTMPIPQDYINYVKISWKDKNGLERVIYPDRKTSNPLAILQDSDYKYLYDSDGNIQTSYDSTTWTNYSNRSSEELSEQSEAMNSDTSSIYADGGRFGIEPENANSNGTFFIDQLKNTIYFSSNLTGKTILLKYISDGLGTDEEMVVHKFAEEAMYKHIACAILSTKINTPPYIIARLKKERFAAIRTAKIRLSNLKTEEIAQIMRNKSKQIKH